MLSAAFDVSMIGQYKWYDFTPEAIVGDMQHIAGTSFDPYYLVEQAIDNGQTLPQLYITCGTEDELYQGNIDFVNYLDEKGISYQFKKRQVITIMHFGIKQLKMSLTVLHHHIFKMNVRI